MKSDRGPVIASLSVIGGVLATISCCLPLPGLALAAGLAGASALLQEIRPLLIGLSLCALAIAFVLAYRKRACSTTSRVSVWIALAVLLVSLVFPEKVANVIAGSAPRGTAVAKPTLLDIESFRAAFNAASDRPRIIVMLSPT